MSENTFLKDLIPHNHKGYPGITKPEYEKLVYKKKYKCIFCKKEFEGFKIFQSKLYESQAMRYDMRKYYKDFQTEWYDVITCPLCYYSTLATYYDDPKAILNAKIQEPLAEARENMLLDFEEERNIDFVFASHYLALLCAPAFVPRRKHITAKIWSNLSWLYEDVEDNELAVMAAENAAKAYEIIYMEENLLPAQEQVVCMTVAGMLFRAGKDDNLKKYLLNVKVNKMGKKFYADMADNLLDLVNEKAAAGSDQQTG